MSHRLLLVLLAVVGCTGSEIGNPPFTPEGPAQPGVDPSGLSAEMDPVGRGTSLRIDEGALVAGSTRLFVTNLETADAVEITVVDEMGAASVGFTLRPDGELRLQLEVEGERRAPLDVVVQADLSVLPAQRSLADCLLLEARDFIVDEAGVDVRVMNSCDAAVELEPPSTRLSSAAFAVEGEIGTLEPMQVGSLLVAATGEAGPSEDVLFLTVTTPSADRRSVTVRLPD